MNIQKRNVLKNQKGGENKFGFGNNNHSEIVEKQTDIYKNAFTSEGNWMGN
jgi:hypothetical protein